MTRYEVSIRTFSGNASTLRTLEVIADKPLQANISAVQALDIQEPRFSVTVKPVKGGAPC
ncbi:MAG TPA: hypothetical protein DCG63_03910 [Methylophilaceae bacterium]|nr:hypothetical protein [Methylophilaceae bacterium]